MKTVLKKGQNKLWHVPIAAVTLVIVFGLELLNLSAQSVGINSTGATANVSALLDVESTDKGILIPRVSLSSTTDVTTIATPATNLLVFNTNASMTNGNGTGFYYYNGSTWTYMVAPSNGPGTSGEVLTSQGGGSAPEWASTGGDCFPTEITNELDGSGNPCSGTGCGTERNLRDCAVACGNLTFNGSSDWRIASLEELVALTAIAPGNTSTNQVWSTTPNNTDSYYLVFSSLFRNGGGPGNINICRCVR